VVKDTKAVIVRTDAQAGSLPQVSVPEASAFWGEPRWEDGRGWYGVFVSLDRPVPGLVPRRGKVHGKRKRKDYS